MKLLATKLRPPALPKRRLSRPRLITALNAALEDKVALIAAPTGYGKLTLAREWMAQSALSCVWLTLDASDNDPGRFLTYLTEALLGTAGRPPEPWPSPNLLSRDDDRQAYLDALINRLHEWGDELVLILNNYETILAEPCHAALTYLIEYSPDNLRVLVLTRADPPLPLARWRARQQLHELRAEDLRFTRAEMRDYVAAQGGPLLTDNEVEALDRRTQGWAVSLRLLAPALSPTSDRERFFRALESGQTQIMDFLVDEALSQLPAELQDFLCQTSVLTRFTGGLCQAVTGNVHSERILRDLERHNLFISRLEEGSPWFRFHPLFAECLGQRLREQPEVDVAALHRRAADWHSANDLAEEALEHAWLAQDLERAARILEANIPQWIDQGEYQIIARWIERLPHDALIRQPRLAALYLCSLADSRNHERFEALADLQEQARTDPEVRPILRAAQALVQLGSDAVAALELADQNLSEFRARPPQSVLGHFAHGLSWSARIAALINVDQLVSADQAMGAAIPVFLQAGLTGYALDTLGARATNQLRLGQLHGAAETLDQGLLLARRWGDEDGRGARSFPAAIRVHGPLSRLHYEHNRLSEAIAAAQKAIEAAQRGGYTWGWRLIEIYATLGLAHHAAGDVERAFQALEHIRRIETLLASHPTVHTSTRLAALGEKIRLALTLAAHEPSLLSRIAEWGHEVARAGIDRNETFMAVWVNYLTAVGREAEARPLLDRIIQQAEAADRRGDLIAYLVLDARPESVARALTLSAGQGYCRTFVDGGERARRGLTLLGTPAAHDVLAAFPPEIGPGGRAEPRPWLNLSERQILELLSREKTNQEIADALHLSVNTVKWYARRIYAALGARNRREAIQAAARLGLP